MQLPPWLWFALVTVFAWGMVGLLQKLSTNHLSAEWALIWLSVGFLILAPWLYPGKVLYTYSAHALGWALLGGTFNAFGAWALLAAMKAGGKASVVSPLTALYPVVVVLLAPLVLHEFVTPVQGVGVVCALIAVVLLSTAGGAT